MEKEETVEVLAARLDQEQIIRHPWLFKKYLVIKGIDKKIQAGQFKVIYPITLARVAASLKNAIGQDEMTVTVIPGWDLRDLAGYLQTKGIIKNKKELYDLTGESAILYKNDKQNKLSSDFELPKYKPGTVSYEGYLAPNTYRVFINATVEDVVKKLLQQQDSLFTKQMYEDIAKNSRTAHEVLTMASILEREVKSPKDKAMVADIFWRRYDKNWALQADSTVHYAVNKTGDVFTTKEDRDSTNPWNTYQFPGLPPGPISAPDLDSIKATIYPEANKYWYFLTTFDGEVKYAEDLDEHNGNARKYLR